MKKKCMLRIYIIILIFFCGSFFIYGIHARGPDLIIEEFRVTTSEPEVFIRTSIRYSIKNNGDMPAGPFKILYYIDGEVPGGLLSVNCQGLEPGDSYERFFTYIFLEEGLHQVQLKVDVEDDVSESNEENNEAALECTIGPSSFPFISDTVTLFRGPTPLFVYYNPDPVIVSPDLPQYALNIAVQALPVMEQFYGKPYEYESMTIIINPSGSAQGGDGMVFIGGGGALPTIDWLMLHEMIHSFWSSSYAPQWFSEGSANSGGAWIRAQLLGLDIEEELLSRREIVWNDIEDRGFTNLLLVDTHGNYDAAARLGDVFLIDMYLYLGRENLNKAYQDLYDRRRARGNAIIERDIARVLARHCPKDKKCDLWRIFMNRIDNSFYYVFNWLWCYFSRYSLIGLIVALLMAAVITMFLLRARRRR